MVEEHLAAVELFKKASVGEPNTKLAQFAKSKLPTLTHHLAEAKNVLKIVQSIREDKGDFPLKISRQKESKP